MPDSDESKSQSGLERVLIGAVLVDLVSVWALVATSFRPEALAFRVGETVIKLLGLKGTLANRWWGYGIVLLLTVLAVGTAIRLPAQKNRRAASNPLTWVSAVAQVTAGVSAAALFFRRKRAAVSGE